MGIFTISDFGNIDGDLYFNPKIIYYNYKLLLMKSIEECLDMILEDLVKNWDKPENKRDFLKAEDLLNL